MRTYQVYSLDANGRICGDRMIEAESDTEIVWTVRSMQRELDTEIWDHDRRIAKVPGHHG
jgi:hypothetical protein